LPIADPEVSHVTYETVHRQSDRRAATISWRHDLAL